MKVGGVRLLSLLDVLEWKQISIKWCKKIGHSTPAQKMTSSRQSENDVLCFSVIFLRLKQVFGQTYFRAASIVDLNGVITSILKNYLVII